MLLNLRENSTSLRLRVKMIMQVTLLFTCLLFSDVHRDAGKQIKYLDF